MAVLYFGLLSAVSHIPGKVLSDIGFDFWDKAVHFIAYAPLGLLIHLGMTNAIRFKRRWIPIVATTIAIILLGSLDEWHQWFIPGRRASLSDVVADALGGAIGALLSPLAARRRESSPGQA